MKPIAKYPAPEAAPEQAHAALIFDDGTMIYGKGIGKLGVTIGEICFNTGLTGYQEILTDPSYTGQVVTFTFPHIGIVGANEEDIESSHDGASGLIVREALTNESNWRASLPLQAWLEAKNIGGICGVDTRAITRKIRLNGAQNIAIASAPADKPLPIDEAKAALAACPKMAGQELAIGKSTKEKYDWSQKAWTLADGYSEQKAPKFHVVAYDFGEKLNILRLLASYGCKVTVVPATTPAAEVLAMKPDGVFLSNGPGDPSATGEHVLPAIRTLIDSGLPIFGICLGHQLLGLAVGAETEKMPQGHRGTNHPVKHLPSGRVEITSQNHGFAVKHGSLPDNAELTHVSLFDGTVQGLRLTDKPVFSVQYHPEASPGPHDSRYLFQEFVTMMENHAKA
jgi:carbamoyl-phosphate synthase small subunit